MHPFKKMILSINTSEVIPQGTGAQTGKESASRSSLGFANTDTNNICAEPLTVDCKIQTQNTGLITSGDIMFEVDGMTRFNGGQSIGGFQAYYNVSLPVSAINTGSKVCLINTDGVLEVFTTCNN